MNDCLFCKIINKEIPAQIIHEDEHTLAFLDIRPIRPGHALVIPKKHVAHFWDMESDDYHHVMETVHTLSKNIQSTLEPQRTGIFIGGWDVPHTHVHIVPMHDRDDITSKSVIDGTQTQATEQELQEMRDTLTQ